MSGQSAAPTLAELAYRVHDLADAVRAARDGMRGGPEDRFAYPLSEAVARLEGTSAELHRVSAAVNRFAGRPNPPCGADWGVCPVHGRTLAMDPDRPAPSNRCTATGCSLRWDYDRAAQPCTETPAARAVDGEGNEMLVCDGHVIAILVDSSVDGIKIEPLRADS